MKKVMGWTLVAMAALLRINLVCCLFGGEWLMAAASYNGAEVLESWATKLVR